MGAQRDIARDVNDSDVRHRVATVNALIHRS